MSELRRRASIDLFGPIRAARASEAVVIQIIDLVSAGRLAVDELLPGERQLAIALDVSRGTVREAIDVLARAGVLAVAPGPAGGIRVASVWVPDALALDPEPLPVARVFELLEARRVIETRVAQLAGLHGTDADFAIMRETIALQRANMGDRARIAQGNARFHRQLWRAGANEELETSMRSIYRRLGGAFEKALELDAAAADPGTAIDIHDETLAAVMRGDPQQIEAVMDRHLAYLEQRYEDAFGRSRIRALPAFLVGPARPPRPA